MGSAKNGRRISVAFVDIEASMNAGKTLMFSGLPKIENARLVTSILPNPDSEFKQQTRETGENLPMQYITHISRSL
jgi:hypothetical protein